MGAIGNYEVIEQDVTLPGYASGETVTVNVPAGKVALGWGWKVIGIKLDDGSISSTPERDVIADGHPAADGSSVTFVFYESVGEGGYESVGKVYVTCAEMGC